MAAEVETPMEVGEEMGAKVQKDIITLMQAVEEGVMAAKAVMAEKVVTEVEAAEAVIHFMFPDKIYMIHSIVK